MSDDPQKQSIVSEVGGWIWGTVQGGFNEQQSISQILVDAAIGMIPVVGDVTAARDLIAVILRLVDNPKKREDKLEWLTLVLLIFALLPVAGGVIKGVGKLIIKAGEDAGRHAELIRDIIEFLNRVGEGNAVKFFKALDFEKYTSDITGKWRKLTQALDDVLGAVMRRAHVVIPDAMMERLRGIQDGVRKLKDIGDRMIPDSLKELNRRLKAVQKHLYEGEWHAISSDLTSATREAEARLVEEVKDGKVVKTWKLENPPYPPNTLEEFESRVGWPDLSKPPWVGEDGAARAVASFSGPIRPVRIAGGTKIRRVVTAGSRKSGAFWSYELARDGASWRNDCAVLDSWSKNGFYIELIVPTGGIWAWEGAIASQIETDASKGTAGQVLRGGATQLLIDLNMAAHADAKALIEALPRLPTHWSGYMGLNVPEKTVTVQKLGVTELEPKVSAAAAAQRGLRAAGSSDSQDNQQPSAP
jgi:hypothetical protein